MIPEKLSDKVNPKNNTSIWKGEIDKVTRKTWEHGDGGRREGKGEMEGELEQEIINSMTLQKIYSNASSEVL